MAGLIDTCGNCDAEIYEEESVMYDEHSELHFCDEQCFREWAEDKGAEKILAFYRRLNVTSATY